MRIFSGSAFLVLALLSGGCADGTQQNAGNGPDPISTPSPSPSPSPTPTPAPELPIAGISLGDGVRLWPGADGRIPVSVRWARQMDGVEALAVDGDVVYVAHELISAHRLSDGTPKWEAWPPDDEGLGGSGEVEIGLAGPDRVRVLAPFEYDVEADRTTGAHATFEYEAGEIPPGFTPLPAPASSRYRISGDLNRMTARRDGQVAWLITVDESWFDWVSPIEIPGGMVLLTSSGLLVALDYQ